MEEDFLQQQTGLVPTPTLAEMPPVNTNPTEVVVNGARNTQRQEDLQFRSSLDRQMTSPFSTPLVSDTRRKANTFDVPFNEVYTPLSDGTYIAKFENYIGGTNNEERLAQQQGIGEKWLNGISKFAAKTGLNVLDATIGTVNGIQEGISNGSFNAVYNNDFSNWIDDLNTKLDSNLANYYTQQERNRGAWAAIPFSEGSANFWAGKVLGGMSFVAGTVISEALWASATGGASLATIGARGALKTAAKQTFKNQNKILHSITAITDAYQRTVPVSKALKAFNNARFLYTSAGYESGVEARHFLKEAEENYKYSFSNTYGRNPNAEELASFKEEATRGANGVFAANLVLVGGSNVAQFGSIFGVAPFSATRNLQRGFMRRLGIGVEKTVEGGIDTYKAINPTKVQRILGTTYNVAKSPIREGVVEEGGQSVFGNFGQRWLESKYDPNAIQDNFSVIDAMTKSLSETYGTKEGIEEVVLGMIIGGMSSARSGFGLSEYRKDLEQQKQFADWKTTNSDYNLTKKFFQASTNKSAIERAKRSFGTEEAVLANQEIKLAMFSKFNVDDAMGLLDNSAANFQMSLQDIDINEIARQQDISVQEAETLKSEMITSYQLSLNDYKEAQRVAEALVPEGDYIGVEGQQSFIPDADVQSMLALNIYMGKNSDRLTRAYANAISETIGDKGTDSAMRIEALLQDEQVNKSREVKKLTKELRQLDEVLNRRNNELIKLAARPRTEAGDNRLQQFEERRQELLAQEERDNQRRDEINTELSQIATSLTNVRKAKNIANQDFNAIFDEATVTAEDLVDATTSLQSLTDTLQAWRDNGQTKAAEDVEYLIDQFDKAQKSFKYANDVYNKMSDPALRQKELKNIFGKFLSSAKKKGADISDYQKAQQDLLGILATQFNGLQQDFNNTFPQEQQTTEETQQTNGDNLPNLQQQTSALSNTEQEIQKDYQQRRQELANNQQQEIEQTPETIIEGTAVTIGDTVFSQRDIDGTTQYLKKEGDAPATIISKEEYDSKFSLENNERITELEREHTQQLENLNQEEQEALRQAREEFAQDIVPQNNTERLQKTVNDILSNRRDVEVISSARRPTEAEQEEYKKLYERNRKSANGLRPNDKERFEDLKDILNAYGRAVGTVENGIRLSDILEQIYNLQNINSQQENNLTINNTNTEDIQAQLSKVSSGGDYSNKAQFWEKSEFRVLEDGTYSITGINLQGMLDIINLSNNAIVLRDKTRKEVKGILTGDKYKPNDKFIVRFEDGAEIRVTIGTTRNLEISPKSVQLLNERTRFKLLASTTLGTNYQPLLQELNSNADITPLEAVNTNFELEPGLSFTDFGNKQDDTALSLYASTRNEYNKNLLQQFRDGKIALKDVAKDMVIYVMSQEGEVGGVLKSLSKNTTTTNGNYAELSDIRTIAAQRAVESNLENELIDLRIEVPLDRGGSYLGKPNFNLLYNKTTGVLSTELIPLSDRAMDKIVDVGYITDGRLTLKDNKKDQSKINTSFVKKLSAGRKIPIIVFNYNGQRVAYPVSMNQLAVDKTAGFDQILNSNLTITEKVNNLNNYLSNNGLNPNERSIGFYNVADDTNIDDIEHIERIRQLLSSEATYNDFTQWVEADNLQQAKDIVQSQAMINIDITDKPFHSPKLGLKLKEKVIIGVENFTSFNIAENQTTINTSEIISENTCNS